MDGPIKARRIESMRTTNYLDSWRVTATSAPIARHDVVRLGSVNATGSAYLAAPAVAGGRGPLMVADHEIPAGLTGLARRTYVIPYDTSGGLLGDSVYLSSVVPGALTLTPTAEPVGWIGRVGVTDGWVMFEPRHGTYPNHILTNHLDVNPAGLANYNLLVYNAGTWYPIDIDVLSRCWSERFAAAAFTFNAGTGTSWVALPNEPYLGGTQHEGDNLAFETGGAVPALYAYTHGTAPGALAADEWTIEEVVPGTTWYAHVPGDVTASGTTFTFNYRGTL